MFVPTRREQRQREGEVCASDFGKGFRSIVAGEGAELAQSCQQQKVSNFTEEQLCSWQLLPIFSIFGDNLMFADPTRSPCHGIRRRADPIPH